MAKRATTNLLATALACGTLAALASTAHAQGTGGVGTGGGEGAETAPPQTGEPPPASVSLHSARVRPRRAFFDGARPIRLAFELGGREAADLRFDVVQRSTGETVATLYREDVEPRVAQALEWDGLDYEGHPARGELAFKIRGVGGEAIPKSSGPAASTEFRLYDHIFPLPARHTYGDGLGAGRDHGGQDVAAGCGKRLIAARGGRVRATGYQARGAGYYVVIDGRANNFDYAYFHLEDPAIVAEGERVRTGQLIGRVGSTGRSFGCHLHFELWRGPWAAGGTRVDPTPALRRWDRYS